MLRCAWGEIWAISASRQKTGGQVMAGEKSHLRTERPTVSTMGDVLQQIAKLIQESTTRAGAMLSGGLSSNIDQQSSRRIAKWNRDQASQPRIRVGLYSRHNRRSTKSGSRAFRRKTAWTGNRLAGARRGLGMGARPQRLPG